MKILVIGGGPAGSVSAKILAKHHDVTLIQNRKDFEKPCGGGVKSKIFSQFDIPKDLIKHELDYIYMHYRGDKIKVDLKGDNLSVVLRKEFDAYLRNSAEEAGAKIFYGRFKRFKNNKAYVKCGEDEIGFEYDILISADGVNSTVRKALNMYNIPATITHYATTVHYPVETCEFFFDKDVAGDYYAWAFPHTNITHIGAVKRENFKKLCDRLGLDLKPKGYKIPLWDENIEIQKDNILFVGDSAGQVIPLSFEGIYYAMHSAKIAAESILENKNYKEEWNKRFLKEFRFMKKLQNMNKTFLRGLIVKAHKLKPVQNFSINLWLGKEDV